jgi:hypothetical protein
MRIPNHTFTNPTNMALDLRDIEHVAVYHDAVYVSKTWSDKLQDIWERGDAAVVTRGPRMSDEQLAHYVLRVQAQLKGI